MTIESSRDDPRTELADIYRQMLGLRRRAHALTVQTKLTPPQAAVVEYIATHGDSIQADIGRSLQINASVLTVVIDSLEKKGRIKRQPARDRRANLCSLEQ